MKASRIILLLVALLAGGLAAFLVGAAELPADGRVDVCLLKPGLEVGDLLVVEDDVVLVAGDAADDEDVAAAVLVDVERRALVVRALEVGAVAAHAQVDAGVVAADRERRELTRVDVAELVDERLEALDLAGAEPRRTLAAELATATTHLDYNGLHLTYVDITSASATAPQRVLGAIVPLGDATWFFKLSGPAPLIAREQAAFADFLKTIRPAGATP